jgi:predicted Zn-dependent protease
LDEAESLVQQLETNLPGSAYTVLLSANLEAARGRIAVAAEELTAYLDSNKSARGPQVNFVRMHKARLLREQGQNEKAASLYRRMVEEDPGYWAAWVSLYRMLEAGGSDEDAATIKRFLDKKGVDPDGWDRGAAALEAGRPGESGAEAD